MLSQETKTTQLEHYLDSVLRASLQTILTERDMLYQRASQCDQLRQLLQATNELSRDSTNVPSTTAASSTPSSRNSSSNNTNTTNSSAMKLPHQTLVDMGHHCYLRANIKSMEQIHVNIGAGIVVPLTREEALSFLSKKEALLVRQGEEKTKESLRVRYRIRLVMEALNRMQMNFK